MTRLFPILSFTQICFASMPVSLFYVSYEPVQDNGPVSATLRISAKISSLVAPITPVLAKQCSIKPNANITTNSRSQMNFGLEVELDADKKRGRLVLSLVVRCASEQLAWMACQWIALKLQVAYRSWDCLTCWLGQA
jgi:hypothetical protein